MNCSLGRGVCTNLHLQPHYGNENDTNYLFHSVIKRWITSFYACSRSYTRDPNYPVEWDNSTRTPGRCRIIQHNLTETLDGQNWTVNFYVNYTYINLKYNDNGMTCHSCAANSDSFSSICL